MSLLLALALQAIVPNPAWVSTVLDRWEGLGVEVTVVSATCGQENAWYAWKDRTIVLCEELFGKPDLAKWVLNHELGHALTDQREVPVRWGSYDQERVADELAFFMSNDSENYAAIAWFLGHANRKQSKNDPHPKALDRAGEILCLQIGYEDAPSKDSYAHACRLMFESVQAHWVRIFDGYL